VKRKVRNAQECVPDFFSENLFSTRSGLYLRGYIPKSVRPCSEGYGIDH
jgi:hypothetical protein